MKSFCFKTADFEAVAGSWIKPPALYRGSSHFAELDFHTITYRQVGDKCAAIICPRCTYRAPGPINTLTFSDNPVTQIRNKGKPVTG